MQTEPNAKQQIVEKIKNSTNILVTVGRDPSVDALSAALSLTLMLNRLDKHATAVFSGTVPAAITFLDPAKTFESSVDSLRDFIIALDKEKADRLRYKVEDDVVRIFITPYRTVINEKDLQFSQGDFNVELIVALGVEQREDLDAAITAHGRILHDATVVTVNAHDGKSTLGTIDWSDTSASSLCEMLMSLSEALQSGLLDQQIATAVLTGIVAATDRFRNEHTSPKVMTMAAQLMAAGANQQLIAAKLEAGHELPTENETTPDGSTDLSDGASQKLTKKQKKSKNTGDLEIKHQAKPDATPLPDPAADALKEAEDELAESLEQAAPSAPTLSVEDLKNDLAAAAQDVDAAASQPVVPEPPKVIAQERRSWKTEPAMDKPAFGGTLNATVSDAEEARRKEEHERASAQMLSHAEPAAAEPPVVPEPPDAAPSGSPTPVPTFEPAPPPDLAATPPPSKPLESTADEALSFEPAPIEGQTLSDLDSQTRGQATDDARAAVDAALSQMPFNPSNQPLESAGAAPVFEIDHDEQPISQPVPPDSNDAPVAEPALPPMAPELPPLPDFSTLPDVPATPSIPPTAPPHVIDPVQPPSATPTSQPLPPAPAVAPDPGQFKIPGQP